MKKRLIALVSICMVFALVFAACGTSQSSEPAATASNSVTPEATAPAQSTAEPELAQTDSVVLYSAGSTDQNDLIQQMWTQAHPDIKLEIVSAGSGELQNRIIAEANNPQGDVMQGGSYAVYAALEDYLAPYVSKNVDATIPEFKSPSDKYTAIQINVNTIMVNNKMVKDLGVTVDGWQSLTNPALKGNITFADPSSSSSGREQIINMLAAMNTTGNLDDGWDFVTKFLANLDGKISSSSSAVPTSVANGEYAVGITNEELVITNIVNGADVSPVYAKEGITLRTSDCGVIKGAKNEYNAHLLVDFLTSKDYQQALTDKLYQRSIRSDVNFSINGVPATTELKAIAYPSEWVDKNADSIKGKFQDIWTSGK